MAFSKFSMAALLLGLLLLHFVAAADDQLVNSNSAATYASQQKIDCGSACIARCRLASRQNMCKRACGTCCARCNCVPPGTSGNQEVCPCYASLTTHGGRRKCP